MQNETVLQDGGFHEALSHQRGHIAPRLQLLQLGRNVLGIRMHNIYTCKNHQDLLTERSQP